MANLNDILNGLVNINSKMANNINNLLDSIGEGFLDIGELTVSNDAINIKDATILVNGSNITIDFLTAGFSGNKICFLEYRQDKTIRFKVMEVVDADFNYDLSQLNTTSKHFEVARQYNGVLEDRRISSMASKDNTIVGALSGALKAIDYDDEIDLEINMDILSRISSVESDIQGLESDILDLGSKKADKTYVDNAVANVDIDGVVTAVDVGEVEDIDVSYVTRDELDEALSGLEVNVDLTSYQEKSDNSLSTTDKTIVGAINELFQSANNGKELIASSIGEPLSSNQTFQAMSDDIEHLLSTFKTNMMHNGITVDSGDKFKSLIDKIATMVEEGGGKGIQYATGKLTPTSTTSFTNVTGNSSNFYSLQVNNITFKPSIILLGYSDPTYGDFITFYSEEILSVGVLLANIKGDGTLGTLDNVIKSSSCTINSTGFVLPVSMSRNYTWIAIGVGEEDTTLRDSLASILQDSGVEVSEDEEMASLITKVDSEFDEATANKNRLYNLMLEGGYEVNNTMSIDAMLGLLESSDISVDTIKQVVGKYDHTFVLKNDGSLWACGNNYYGQLGLGDNITRHSFTRVSISDVKQIACGNVHTFILKNDGTLWGCGYNEYGQLGLGTTIESKNTFTQVTTNTSNIKQVVCTSSDSFILKNDGKLWACGGNGYGQLGFGNTDVVYTFTQVSDNIGYYTVNQIACGGDHIFAILSNGKVYACGRNDCGQLGLNDTTDRTRFTQVTTNISNIKEIIGGGDHTMLLKTDGTVYACGGNGYGQLGLNSYDDKTTFTKVSTNASNVKQVSCGIYHTMILSNNGAVYSCGTNYCGLLGLGNTDTKATFTQVRTNISNVQQIICCYDFTFILKTDGTLHACGYNEDGQLGLGTTTYYESDDGNEVITLISTFIQVPQGF